jgi:hypothetical protein
MTPNRNVIVAILIEYSNLYSIPSKRTTIGGSDPEKFVPNLNIGFNCESILEQAYLNVNYPNILTSGRLETFSNNELRLSNTKETSIWKLDLEGNLKWNIELQAKPVSNIFEWTFTCSEDLQFYLQPVKYTPWEISVGAHRPEHIKGSYAVYINKQGHYLTYKGETLINYKQGKILHIPRPLCYDKLGTEIWGELFIEKLTPTSGIIRITVPQSFLDTSTYPVTIDPTFGYTTVPGTEAGFSNCYGNIGNSHTASTGDEITKYTVYGYYITQGSGSVDATVYTISGGAFGSRLAAGTTITLPAAPAWTDSGVVSQVMSNGVEYGPAIGDEVNTMKFFYDAAPAGSMGYDSSTVTLPATWTETGPYAFLLGLYATYTAGAGGLSIPVAMHHYTKNLD